MPDRKRATAPSPGDDRRISGGSHDPRVEKPALRLKHVLTKPAARPHPEILPCPRSDCSAGVASERRSGLLWPRVDREQVGVRAILPRVLSRLFWLVLVLVIAEGLAAGLCWALWWRSSAGRFVWHPQNPTRPDHPVTALVTEIDNDIGGAPIFSAASGAPRDRTGAKLNAEFPDPASNCGAAYGESLVLGYEVPLADGWVEQLSHLIGCRIANYAVNYYGPDQAYRRFQLTGSPSSFVILGIDPSTIMDVVSQYTALIGSPAG